MGGTKQDREGLKVWRKGRERKRLMGNGCRSELREGGWKETQEVDEWVERNRIGKG